MSQSAPLAHSHGWMESRLFYDGKKKVQLKDLPRRRHSLEGLR